MMQVAVLCLTISQMSQYAGGLVTVYEYKVDAGELLRLHILPARWSQAALRCQFEGGLLASPINDDVTRTMVDAMAVRELTRVFIGVTDVFSKGTFKSLDGVLLSDMRVEWAPHEPNNEGGNERCVTLTGAGAMADYNCTPALPYFCRKRVQKTAATMNITSTTDITSTPELASTADITTTTEITTTPAISTSLEINTTPEIITTPEITYKPDITTTSEITTISEVDTTTEITTTTEINSTPETTSIPEIISTADVIVSTPDLISTTEITSTTSTTEIISPTDIASTPEIIYTPDFLSTPDITFTTDISSTNVVAVIRSEDKEVTLNTNDIDSSPILWQLGENNRNSDEFSFSYPKCPKHDYNWSRHTGKCYKYHRVPKTLQLARVKCLVEGGRLAQYEDPIEYTLLKELFKRSRKWGDASLAHIDGEILSVGGFDQSRRNEPYYYNGKKSCQQSYVDGTYNSDLCVDPLPFICEMKPVTVI